MRHPTSKSADAARVIQVEDLSKSFRTYRKRPGLVGSLKGLLRRDYEFVQAVKNISFSIAEGELVGFVGPNGAGKTTVFNLVTGAYKASEGEIIFQGDNLVGKASHTINALGISRTTLWRRLRRLGWVE